MYIWTPDPQQAQYHGYPTMPPIAPGTKRKSLKKQLKEMWENQEAWAEFLKQQEDKKNKNSPLGSKKTNFTVSEMIPILLFGGPLVGIAYLYGLVLTINYMQGIIQNIGNVPH